MLTLVDDFRDAHKDAISALQLRPIDVAFAHFIYSQESQNATSIALLSGLLSRQVGKQDTCLFLDSIDQQTLGILGFDDSSQMRMCLQNAAVVSSIQQQKAADKPLIFEHDKLYMQRYWAYETHLSDLINQKVRVHAIPDVTVAKEILPTLFPDADSTLSTPELDWQQVAVCIAASSGFSMITGGPGTGKTTTVAKLIALLQGLSQAKQQTLKVELVAPTGKAAARLTESITAARQHLPMQYRDALNLQCRTIHRLLGSVPNRISFKHNNQNPLHLDVLIVDEASMVDLPLMYRLFSALPIHAKIILLGDQNQLSSVEAGSVLSDLCAAAKQNRISAAFSQTFHQLLSQMIPQQAALLPATRNAGGLSDHLIMLQKSHRFSASSGIGKLARCIIEQRLEDALTLLSNPQFSDVRWDQTNSVSNLVTGLVNILKPYFTAVKQGDVLSAFSFFEQVQILCAQKKGEWGTIAINALIERELTRQGMINLERKDYLGRPIMLAQNDHTLQVFNGDIGIVMPDPQSPQLNKVWFKMATGEVKGILVNRLPEHDTVYAMTIHKSQGSEFAEVYMCLPTAKEKSLVNGLNRELFYTGLTRAKSNFTLYADKATILHCLQHGCRRSTGLAERLSHAN